MIEKAHALSLMGGAAFISGVAFYIIGYAQAKKRWKHLYDAASMKAESYSTWYKKMKAKYEMAVQYAADLKAAKDNPHE